MIRYADDLNIEEFLADLCMTSSITFKSGCQSWDPNGWVVGLDFRKKYKALF